MMARRWQSAFWVARCGLIGALVVVGLAHAVVAEESPATISPAEALARLKAGNARYAADHATHPHIDAGRRHETAVHGQHPFASVLACSDSRVPPEILFDQGLGDLFVIRVAGNVDDVDETGSIEYGIGHLGTPLLVVLGHSQCGAVTAVATHAELHGSIPALVDNISPAVARAQKAHPELQGEALVPAAIEANVWVAIENLFQNSPEIRARVGHGRLLVIGALYDLENGRVRWLGEHPSQARLVKLAASAAEHAHGSRP